ncbi:OPT superfamily oligopeptide transporter [Jaminaea rosea]|uniref:OPT superfamily oligopeptide transporter n=1 Tax=Jaminaea rosea TaxID=1569628 RepID=A0A316UW12_9BASI|nr:OPT superfamily oligopeptide transporter [Jaminaea rosea]PWN28113.1 OPT superfamily oligopeptide transporter [Jaminaea rosea]
MSPPSSPSSSPPSQPSSSTELTGRAILIGLIVGSLLCFTNCYFGLQSSWISMSSMQSALVGYGLVKLLPRTSDEDTEGAIALPSDQGEDAPASPSSLFWRYFGTGRFTPQENVVLAATAVALGSMPLTVGLIGIVPALAQLKPERDHGALPVYLTGWHLLLWCAALSFFGVFFASPLRKRTIVKEKLVFPSGTATAHLVGVLHGTGVREDRLAASKQQQQQRPGQEENGANDEQPLLNTGVNEENGDPHSAVVGQPAWTALIWSFLASLAFTFSSALLPVLYVMPVFDVLPPHNLARVWGWYLTPSLSYIGQGIIMGLHTTASMLVGAIFGWAFLSPLAHNSGWTDAPPMDAESGSKGWILWISLAIMTAESFVGLAVIFFAEVTSQSIRTSSSGDDEEDEPSSRLPPPRTIIVGLALSSLFAVGTLYALFGREGIEPYTTVVAIVLAFALSVLAVRALGSTDLNPVAALGKMSQLVFAILQPHNIVANMIAGGLCEAGAMQSGELLQTFKTGHLTGTSPRSQFWGQLMGSFAGIFVSSYAYQLYTKIYTIPSPSFPAPAASMWLNFARLVNNGEVPRHSTEWMVGCGAVFAVTGTIKAVAQARASKRSAGDPVAPWERWAFYLPSGIAFAVGLLNTPNFSIARFIGGVVSHLWMRNMPGAGSSASSSRILIIIVASGFVLGEGAGSIINLFAKQAGLRPLSCAGCRGGCGGGC